MKRSILLISTILTLIFCSSALAEIKTFMKEYTYQASEIDSKVSCRVISLELVKRLLLEELGVYLESQTEVKNFQLTKDQITVLTAGIVRAEILDESWDGNTLKYFLKAKITVDPDSIIKSIDRIRNDQKKTKELEDVRKKADQAMEEIERLNKDLSSTRADMDKMKQYNKAVNKLSATDWFNMAVEENSKYEPNKELIISYYEKAVSLNPEYAEAYFQLGTIYLLDKANRRAEGHDRQNLIYLDKAIAAYEKAIEYNKDKENEKSIYSLLSGAYSERGHVDKAIATLEKSIRLQAPKGLSKREDIKKLSRDYDTLGDLYKKKGDYRQAISAFNKAVELSPDWLNYQSLAWAYQSIGNYVEAINAFKKVVKLSPVASNYESLGTVYKLNRNYNQAIREFKNAIEVDPDNYWSYKELGSCYQLKGNKKLAKAAYQKAYDLEVASKKKEEDFLKLSADDLCNTAIREFGKEKNRIWDYLYRAIKLRPEYALPHYLMGVYHLERNANRGQAIREFTKAIELGFNNADVYYWLGEAYYLELLNGKLMKADEIKDKNWFIATFNKLTIEAINILNKAIELNPGYKNNYLVLGDIYRINSQYDIAQDNYKKALRIKKSTSLESDKYMGKYYRYRKDLDDILYDGFLRACEEKISTFKASNFSDDEIKKSIATENFYPCLWLSVVRE